VRISLKSCLIDLTVRSIRQFLLHLLKRTMWILKMLDFLNLKNTVLFIISFWFQICFQNLNRAKIMDFTLSGWNSRRKNLCYILYTWYISFVFYIHGIYPMYVIYSIYTLCMVYILYMVYTECMVYTMCGTFWKKWINKGNYHVSP